MYIYGEFVGSLLTTYGTKCWFLIYQADSRMRAGHSDRILRRLQIEHDDGNILHGFKPAKPWGSVFAASVKDRVLGF